MPAFLRPLRRPSHRRCLRGCVSPRSPARLRRPRAPQLGRRGYCASSTFACNSPVTISVFELASLDLQRFWALLKVYAIELHAEFLVCVSVVTHGHRSQALRPLRRLLASGAWCAVRCQASRCDSRLGPAAAHGHRSQALLPPTSTVARPCRRPRAPQPGQCGYCVSSTFACNSPVSISVFELASLDLQRFFALLKVHAIELHAEFLLCVSVVTHGHRSPVQRLPRMLRIRIGCCYLDRL